MLNDRKPREDLQSDASILNPVVRAGVGGLNLVDGALTTPLTDSSIARNVVVGNDGILRRRPGTGFIRTMATSTLGTTPNIVNMASITTPRGHDFLLTRFGRTVAARHIRQSSSGGGIQVVSTGFAPILSGGSDEGRFLVLRDPRIRVLLFTPSNPTLEIRVNEVRVIGPGPTASQITLPRDELEQRVPGVHPQQALHERQFNVMVNGLRKLITGLTYDANNLTISIEENVPAGATVDIQLFQGYWWAEAEMYYGDRFSDTVIRTNLTDQDLHVPIPSNLRDGMEQRGTDTYSPYNLDAYYWTGSNYALYTQVSNGLPVGTNQFAMSDGAARKDNSPVVPSPLFMTYGEYQPGTVTPITLHRHRRLNTRGGAGSRGVDLEVYVDDTRLLYVGGTGDSPFPSYRMFDETDSNQITNLNTRGQFISLDGQWLQKPQVNPSSVVKVIEFQNEYAPPGVARVPVYGLTTICDYAAGSFPSCGATYQNRLVIAGMPHDPLVVAFSALYDSRTPQEPYMYFQNDPLDLQPDSGAFQVRLDSTADDRIVALEEFQGSLFVITYRSVFRIAAAGRAVITASNYFVSSVASIGAVNSRAIARPEGGIAFLSPRGVFAIVNGVQSNEATEYKLIELSTKISPIFDATLSTKGRNRLWWMSYATDERRLYVGISNPHDTYHASELYTYDMLNEAWSTMDTVGGFRSYAGVDTAIERDLNQHYLVVDQYSMGSFDLISTGLKLHLDYQQSIKGSSAPVLEADRISKAPRHPETRVPNFNVDPSTPVVTRSIIKVLSPMSPLTSVRDIQVSLLGVKDLEPGVDYVKLPGNYIRILDPLDVGYGTLLITPLTVMPGSRGPTSHNLGVAVEGLPDNDFQFTHGPDQVATATYNQWDWVRELTLVDHVHGVMFQSVWASPVYTLGQITQDKRLNAITVYTERIRNRDHWFGIGESYNSSGWPQLELSPLAGTEPFTLDATIERNDAFIGVITDQEDTLTHPHHLAAERDFYNPDEGLNESLTLRPERLQIPDGIAARREFTDVVNVFQLVVTSLGQQPFGISALQVEASLQSNKHVHKSR